MRVSVSAQIFQIILKLRGSTCLRMSLCVGRLWENGEGGGFGCTFEGYTSPSSKIARCCSTSGSMAAISSTLASSPSGSWISSPSGSSVK